MLEVSKLGIALLTEMIGGSNTAKVHLVDGIVTPGNEGIALRPDGHQVLIPGGDSGTGCIEGVELAIIDITVRAIGQNIAKECDDIIPEGIAMPADGILANGILNALDHDPIAQRGNIDILRIGGGGDRRLLLEGDGLGEIGYCMGDVTLELVIGPAIILRILITKRYPYYGYHVTQVHNSSPFKWCLGDG